MRSLVLFLLLVVLSFGITKEDMDRLAGDSIEVLKKATTPLTYKTYLWLAGDSIEVLKSLE